MTRNWNFLNDILNVNCSVGNEIIHSEELLKYNLCDYNDAYILVRDDMSIIGCNLVTKLAFKNCAPFITGITNLMQQQ